MSRSVVVQYAGFTSKPIVHEHCFLVREVSSEPRQFAFTDPNEALPEEESPEEKSIKCRESV
jgi:hypothetical protein